METRVFRSYEERKDEFTRVFKPLLGEEVVEDMIERGFLTAPASTKYHGNYAGGLFDHSYNVALQLQELTDNNKLTWKTPHSPMIVGILHDLCKIDQYKEVVDAADGDRACSHYEYNNDVIVKGHGMKSVLYAQFFGIRLSDEEIACMIYHMGAFTDKEEWKDYTAAVHKFPNVLWTHTADMIVSHIMGV